MNGRQVFDQRQGLDDAALEAMLRRRVSRASPMGLREAIVAEVATTPQRRDTWRPRLAWPDLRPERRLIWVLLVLGLLVALSAAALFAGSNPVERQRSLPRDPSALTPSGIEVMTPDTGSYDVVADGAGDLWARNARGLVRFTPATGAARTWTVSDDARFADGNDITPARAGGVWLIGERSLRRFDGAGFREAVDVGAAIVAAAEAPDRSLWAATSDGFLVHVTGSSWNRISMPASDPSASISAFAVDAVGRVWCGWTLASDNDWYSTGWLSRYDGGDWVTFDAKSVLPLGGAVLGVTGLADGSVVATTSRGIARFSGASWTDLTATAPKPAAASSAAMAADGSLWTAGADLTSGSVSVGRLVDGRWTLFGPADGLPGVGDVSVPLSTVVTNDGVYVATRDGLYKLGDGRWDRQWPWSSKPDLAGLTSFAAASRDEAWAWSYDSLWHFANGSWTAQPDPPSSHLRDLRRTSDGTLWAAVWDIDGQVGDAYRLRGGQWAQVAYAPAALGTEVSGLMWVAGLDRTVPRGTVVRSFGFDGQSWSERSSTTKTELVTGCLNGVAVGGDGSVWLGWDECFWQNQQAGLARYRNGSWESVRPPGAGAKFTIRGLASAPDGSVWVLGRDQDTASVVSGASTSERRAWLARFDGTAWQVFDARDGLPGVYEFAAAPSGAIWAATSGGLARFDGAAWTTVMPGLSFYRVDVAPDGTVWVAGGFGVGRLDASLTGR